jgi:hypothetical protein
LKFISSIRDFFGGLYRDERIPVRDRRVLAVMMILVVSPLDAIPDWIPFVGVFDDLFFLALIGDYFFRVLDPEIVLGRWPFGLISFQRIKRFFTAMANPVPKSIRNLFWKYRPSPYRVT